MSHDEDEDFEIRRRHHAKVKRRWLRQILFLAMALAGAVALQQYLKDKFSLRNISRQGPVQHEVELH